MDSFSKISKNGFLTFVFLDCLHLVFLFIFFVRPFFVSVCVCDVTSFCSRTVESVNSFQKLRRGRERNIFQLLIVWVVLHVFLHCV